MKRLLPPLFALVLASPVWAQDDEPGADENTGDASVLTRPDQRMSREEFCDIAPAGTEGCPDEQAEESGLDNGPPADAISDLLDLLDTPDDAPVSARPQSDPCDLIPDMPELVDCEAPEADDMDDGTTAPDLENVLRLDDDPADEIDDDEADETTTPSDGPDDQQAQATDASAENSEPPASDSDGDDQVENSDEAENTDADQNADGDAEVPEADSEENSDGGDEAEAEPAQVAEHSITTATPFLTSAEYIALRPESAGEALQLVWSVQRETVDGEAVGEAIIRTLIISPDAVRDESPDEISVFDFMESRHLVIDADAATMTNIAFTAEVRRRLDTYLSLSQGGRLEDIPLGPNRSFDRFWLEAAMGIRREPVSLASSYDAGSLSVQRGGDLVILSAQFSIEEDDADGEPTTESDATDLSEDDADADAATQQERDDINLAATLIDFSSDDSMVFDPSQAASPINLNLTDASVAYPDGDPAEQAQAELFRRWMRHALPIHPDALSSLEGAPRIPDEFAFFVVSPESPSGRREVWTLQSFETVESGFRLEDDLAFSIDGSNLITDRFIPAAIDAMDAGESLNYQRFLDEIENHRAADDLVRAYLVSIQEQHHDGSCPPVIDDTRPVCRETGSLISAGLGNPSFEQLFGLIAGPVGAGNQEMISTLEPYRDSDDLAGAAARVLTAKALLAWAARDPEGPPAELSPFDLFAEAIEIDPLASGIWWDAGNALLTLRDPLSGWALFETGRSLLPPDNAGILQQVDGLEERLRALAPEFFLPR